MTATPPHPRAEWEGRWYHPAFKACVRHAKAAGMHPDDLGRIISPGKEWVTLQFHVQSRDELRTFDGRGEKVWR